MGFASLAGTVGPIVPRLLPAGTNTGPRARACGSVLSGVILTFHVQLGKDGWQSGQTHGLLCPENGHGNGKFRDRGLAPSGQRHAKKSSHAGADARLPTCFGGEVVGSWPAPPQSLKVGILAMGRAVGNRSLVALPGQSATAGHRRKRLIARSSWRRGGLRPSRRSCGLRPPLLGAFREGRLIAAGCSSGSLLAELNEPG